MSPGESAVSRCVLVIDLSCLSYARDACDAGSCTRGSSTLVLASDGWDVQCGHEKTREPCESFEKVGEMLGWGHVGQIQNGFIRMDSGPPVAH